MGKKYIYFFGEGKAEGNANMKDLLGGKGANLAEMTNAGIPVPPGFTITTEMCTYFYQHDGKLPDDFDAQLKEYLSRLEKVTGKKFGDKENPLLVSVRSGAKISMPGMMDTILNLGLNDESVKGLAKASNNEKFAYDVYRRFIQMFGNVVMGIDKDEFERVLEEKKKEKGVKYDYELDADDFKEIVEDFKKIYKEKTGQDFPQDPMVQLKMAINAVFKSWNNPRAVTYRKINKIPDDLGTAVNVQAMVFGNMGNDSGTGVGFTRNPSTGEKEFYGEYLTNAQGEDVVAGIRTPNPISKLKEEMPEVYNQLKEITERLEKHYRDVQDFEFTIEKGKLYMLQTRTGKRTPMAAVKIAVDMVKEGLITKEEAIMRIEPSQIEQLLHPIIDPKVKVEPIAKGLPASPGAACGKVVFTADDAEKRGKEEPVILVRAETSPDDIHGMNAAKGILTSRGGMTSHAAVVARGMGKPCVVGCEALQINEEEKKIIVNGKEIKEGDWITIDGGTGNVMLGKIPTVEPGVRGEFKTLMEWVDEFRKLGVRANADIPRDAKKAREFGAEGIGLCRTEHMFFAPERLPIVQEMILAETEEERRKALDKLLPFQREDFEGIFEAMHDLPVTVRLLDPPLHEFVPHDAKGQQEMADVMGVDVKVIAEKVEDLSEFNPMLGHRGCRLGNTYPEITEMQTRAILEAAVNLKKKGVVAKPEIMIPLIGTVKEFEMQEAIVREVAEKVFAEKGEKVDYMVGTMIEIPRAALTADKIAEKAEFFSFGTNDLTQMGFGYSRDDAGKFLPIYIEKGLLKHDPFEVLDQEGIGQLVEMACVKGKQSRPDIKLGICGEHGGEPSSVEFCHRTGLAYVSCSPFRVPIARLAAAQAALR